MSKFFYSMLNITEHNIMLLSRYPRIRQYLILHKEQMERKGLHEIFIRDIDILPAVILTYKDDDFDDVYWHKVREDIRKYGAEYVSNIYYIDVDNDIDEDYQKFV